MVDPRWTVSVGRAGSGRTLMGLLDGARAVVTGAGSGIGRETCLRFAAEGAAVVALDVEPESARAVANEIGGEAVEVAADARRGAGA